MSKIPQVTIEITGGVAYVKEKSVGVRLTIIDYDNKTLPGMTLDDVTESWDEEEEY